MDFCAAWEQECKQWVKQLKQDVRCQFLTEHLFQLLSTEMGTIRNKRRVTLSEHVGSVCVFGKKFRGTFKKYMLQNLFSFLMFLWDFAPFLNIFLDSSFSFTYTVQFLNRFMTFAALMWKQFYLHFAHICMHVCRYVIISFFFSGSSSLL